MRAELAKPNIGKKILKELKTLLLRKHLREISFALGTVSISDWLNTIRLLLFRRKELVQGKYIEQFERAFSEYTDTRYAFSFGAGRMAFYAILKAVDIKEGDEVILPGYTCVVVPDAVIYCGAKPVYVDIDPKTLTIDISKIEEKITPRTKAILAQHMFASYCDIAAISKIAGRHKLKIIEDCAHTLGAEYQGRKIGGFSDAAFFTMEQSKIISTWMGGVAVTNNTELAKKLRVIQRDTNFPDSKAVTKIALQIVLRYPFLHPATVFIGRYLLWLLTMLVNLPENILPQEMEGVKPGEYPVRLSNLQARIGLQQLKKIEANLKHRREIAGIYEDALKGLGISFKRNDGYNPAHIRYTIKVRDRQRLREIFRNNQVELGEWYDSVAHPRGSSLEAIYYKTGSCPAGEFAAEHCANLPTHPSVSKKDAERITALLQQHSNLLLNPGKEMNS